MESQFQAAPPAGAEVPHPSRRRLLVTGTGVLCAFWTVPGAFAEALTRTPAQTEGPFYPDRLPLDSDNDLVKLKDSLTPAAGEVTHLFGRVLNSRGEPVKGAVIEIWQVDANGSYLHSRGINPSGKRDPHFQGFGRFETGSTGEYRFRTIKPVPYPGRTPHIHVKVLLGNRTLLTTQCYVEGEPRNEQDGIYRSLGDARAKKAVTVPFVPMKESPARELSARWDIVLGTTPGE
jgi:protocatechuate 3,4-dioxygenase beta subunit